MHPLWGAVGRQKIPALRRWAERLGTVGQEVVGATAQCSARPMRHSSRPLIVLGDGGPDAAAEGKAKRRTSVVAGSSGRSPAIGPAGGDRGCPVACATG